MEGGGRIGSGGEEVGRMLWLECRVVGVFVLLWGGAGNSMDGPVCWWSVRVVIREGYL